MEKKDNTYCFDIEGLTFVTPEIPALTEIFGHNLSIKDQKWKRIPFPENFDFLPAEERQELIKTDIIRRLNGFWFMNNGTPIYLTGDQYFYLNGWPMNAETEDGFPQYKRTDLEWFYHWEICQVDKDSLGQIYVTNRRDGKSERALACIYNKTSLFENKWSGLQGKTKDDARDNLFARVIRSWQEQPEATKPVDEGIEEPKKALRFFPPSKRSTKKVKRVAKKALRSRIDFGPTKASHYQGKKLYRILLDEPATIDEMSLEEWFSTVKKCLFDGIDIIGKMLLPATIENMKFKGGLPYMNLYLQSDPKKRNANGRTQSGLYSMFKPAYRGLRGFIDEYGDDVMTPEGEYAAKIYLQNERDGATPEEQIKLKRQYPFTIEEAFDTVAGEFWEDDVKEILKHVRTHLLNELPPMLYCTPFELNGHIEFGEKSQAHEGVCRLYEKAKEGVVYRAGFDGAGSDQQTGDQDGSKVAFVVLKLFEGVDKDNFLPVFTFALRPKKMEQAYQIVYLASKHYGQFGNFKLLGESNAGQAPAVLAYFGNRGASNLLMKKPKNTGMKYNETTEKYWIYRNDPVKEQQKYLANVFIRRYGPHIKHLDLVEDLIDLGKRNVDKADAFLMALLGAGDFDKTLEKQTVAKRPRMIMQYKRGPDGFVRQEWVIEGQNSNNPIFKQ